MANIEHRYAKQQWTKRIPLPHISRSEKNASLYLLISKMDP